MRKLLKLGFSSPLLGLAVWLMHPPTSAAAQGGICTSPLGGSCTTHVHWACTDCWLFTWNWPEMAEASKEGTRIEHCVCSDGYTSESWSAALCGQCGGNGSGGS